MIKGIDCNTKLSYNTAVKIKRSGYDFAIRYVGRFTMNKWIDIDKKEIDNILRAGLDLGIVQHCPGKGGIMASKELGKTYGSNAAKFALKEGYKNGSILYLDLENVNKKYQYRTQEILDFCNYWYDQVNRAYTPGIYVGYNTWLSGKDLYYDLKFKNYWRSLSWVPDIPSRGYSMAQYAAPKLHGIQIDKNLLTGDNWGNMPPFMKGYELSDPKEKYRIAARKILDKEMTLDYWENIKYFDEFLYKLGKIFEQRSEK